MTSKSKNIDVCLIAEGTYPYVSGGVSSWTHDLILKQSHLNFYLVCFLPPKGVPKLRYDIPENVVGISNVYLQNLPLGTTSLSKKERNQLFSELELPLLHLQHIAGIEKFQQILHALEKPNQPLGKAVLLNSEESWNMLVRMYRATMGDTSFLNFFWSWRGLMSSFYSVLLADIPEAKVYHSLCTGYAGLLLARAYLKTGRPCFITEHGIYTYERRIEITSSLWLGDQKSMDLNIMRKVYDRDLKDYWIDSFSGYSKICYEACSKIVTLYEGNMDFQIDDGADPEKMQIIPNGVDVDYYSQVKKDRNHQPTIALIGRVVPIKDTKCFIRAAAILRKRIPNLRAWIIGPTEEDEDYYKECVEIVKKNELEETITFTGKVKITDYLHELDVLVLTSISEVQPLVLLEAGAAGIPCVATDVGACRELIFGRSDEAPSLGQAGEITALASPESTADSVHRMLTDRYFYNKCSQVIKERIRKYYNIDRQAEVYTKLYQSLLEQ